MTHAYNQGVGADLCLSLEENVIPLTPFHSLAALGSHASVQGPSTNGWCTENMGGGLFEEKKNCTKRHQKKSHVLFSFSMQDGRR